MHQGCVRSRQRRRGGSGGVVADIAKLSVGREEYYTRELAENHEQYLSGHGESPGRWYGAGASSLGLQGEASVAGFQAMFEGRDPTTGELLGRPHGRNAVPGFDCGPAAEQLAGVGVAALEHAPEAPQRMLRPAALRRWRRRRPSGLRIRRGRTGTPRGRPPARGCSTPPGRLRAWRCRPPPCRPSSPSLALATHRWCIALLGKDCGLE